MATDPNGDSLSYSIVGGSDQSQFSINSTTGSLEFMVPPDFENPLDSNLDNTYEVIVEANDGNRSDQSKLFS